MADFIMLMHTLPGKVSEGSWDGYLDRLAKAGHLRGGSAIGGGKCFNKSGIATPVSAHLSGFIRIDAESLDATAEMLVGNPVFEAGGTVEIRELPETD